MRLIKLIYILPLFVLAGCKKSDIIAPPKPDETNLINTNSIAGTTMKKMEGIYSLVNGNTDLGTQFVCKVSRFKVSFFSEKEGIYIILKYGLKNTDGSIQFSGFWRYSEKADQGIIQFSIASTDGASDLLNGIVSNLKIKGIGTGNTMVLQYQRPFTAQAINKAFMVIGHHGVQTTVDPPFAENSLNAVLNFEDYGVNGLEFDVRMTKDNVPICIHDATIDTRLTQKGPLIGSWDKYSYALINQYIRLVDGQKVPTVEQVINSFIDSTNLNYLWLDLKGNTDIFKYLEPIIRKGYQRAAAANRNVVLFTGLPSEDVIDELKKQPSFSDLPTLCELSVDKAIEIKSKFYGPRFSKGLVLDEVAKAKANNIKVISWTLNSKGLIVDYLRNGQFDGFITDYPAYVVYNIYTMF